MLGQSGRPTQFSAGLSNMYCLAMNANKLIYAGLIEFRGVVFKPYQLTDGSERIKTHTIIVSFEKRSQFIGGRTQIWKCHPTWLMRRRNSNRRRKKWGSHSPTLNGRGHYVGGEGFCGCIQRRDGTSISRRLWPGGIWLWSLYYEEGTNGDYGKLSPRIRPRQWGELVRSWEQGGVEF